MDREKIEKNLANLESMAYAILDECQQTRKLLEADVSTPAKNNSKIAQEARTRLNKRLFTPRTIKAKS